MARETLRGRGEPGKIIQKKQVNCLPFKKHVISERGSFRKSIPRQRQYEEMMSLLQSKKIKSESGEMNHIRRQAFAKLPKVTGMLS